MLSGIARHSAIGKVLDLCSIPSAPFNSSATSSSASEREASRPSGYNGPDTHDRSLICNQESTIRITCLPRCAEGGSLSCLLDASVPIGGDQPDSVSPRSLRSSNNPDHNSSISQSVTLPGLEGSVLVTGPMRLPYINSLILGGSCLLECLLEHHLVEEAGDENIHATLLTVYFQCMSDNPRNVTSARLFVINKC